MSAFGVMKRRTSSAPKVIDRDIISVWEYWYKASRLLHQLGRRPPAEAEAEYYAQRGVGPNTDHS
jgi:hypothetical protein